MPDIARRHCCYREESKISYLEWKINLSTEVINSRELLLLHGLADCAVVWSSLGEYLADCYHIVAPDLRGHGESSKSDNGYSSSDIIADLEALMAHLGWSQAHTIGHSWGGKLAAIWATQNPQRFHSLILVDPFYINRLPSWLKITFPLLYRVLPFLRGMGPFDSQAEAVKLARNLKQYRQWSELQQKVFYASVEPKSNGTWGSKFTVAARNRIFEDVMQQAGLTKPLTLFIQPSQGLNRTEWQLKPYRRYLSNLKIEKITGNHWLFLVNPYKFNAEIAGFLDQQSN